MFHGKQIPKFRDFFKQSDYFHKKHTPENTQFGLRLNLLPPTFNQDLSHE